MVLGIAAICVALGACTVPGAPVAPYAQIPDFSAVGTATGASDPGAGMPPAPQSFLATDAAMRAWVAENVARVVNPDDRLRTLTRLLLDPADRGIVYDPAVTRSAAELFRARTGNCLSFAGLFVALAREARLEAWFQDVPVLPNWRLDGDTFVVERHVNAIVRAGRNEYVIDFRPPAAVASTRARRISDANAAAQYLGNLGVERFQEGDLRGAYALFRRGLESDAAAASLWINLGVVLGRNRQLDAAAEAYGQALRLEPDNLSALSNLAGLELSRGNLARERELRARVQAYRALNPYYQYWLGEGRLRGGDADGALEAFAEAARLLPEEADFRFAQARAALALGRVDDARRRLGEALERAPTDGARMRYTLRFDEAAGKDRSTDTGEDTP